MGPTASDCGTDYNTGQVTGIYSGYQKLVLHTAGDYKLEAGGAMGGYVAKGKPGSGAAISATFNLPADTVLIVVVGQMGGNSSGCSDGGGGGGGGTFIAMQDAAGSEITGVTGLEGVKVKPLLVAGGGAGNNDDAWGCAEVVGQKLTVTGGYGVDSSGGSAPPPGSSCGGSQGAGWDTNPKGESNHGRTKPFLQGAYAENAGGWRNKGGFGGGAASCNSGGGGGGYWGGADGERQIGKGITKGGTSYADASAKAYQGADNANAGQGYARITPPGPHMDAHTRGHTQCPHYSMPANALACLSPYLWCTALHS